MSKIHVMNPERSMAYEVRLEDGIATMSHGPGFETRFHAPFLRMQGDALLLEDRKGRPCKHPLSPKNAQRLRSAMENT